MDYDETMAVLEAWLKTQKKEESEQASTPVKKSTNHSHPCPKCGTYCDGDCEAN